MGLGILEDKVLSHVPGTERLDDTDSASLNHHNLKKSAKGIILVPQPSDDPNDPLNWPLWRRDMITGLLCSAAVLASTLSPIMAANSIWFLSWFSGISITQVAMLTGWHLLGCGIGGYFFVASARIWGKRHLYLLGMIIIVISTVWAGYSGHNYKSLVAARFFQGVGLAPFEALLNASVGEMYFVHESGPRMAMSNMSLFGAAFITPVIVGPITVNLGWPWTFWFVAIFVGVLFPAVFLLCPETAFVRDTTPPRSRDMSSVSSLEHDAKGISTVEKLERSSTHRTESSDPETAGIQYTISHLPIVSRQSIRIFTGRKTNENFWKVLVRPLPMYFHPSVLWACLVQGSIVGWTTLLGVMLGLIMAELGFDVVQTGNMYLGAFIGALLGLVACGVASDLVPKWMTKWNKGVYEPEFRMLLMVPLMVFSAGGLYGFGFTVSSGWLLPDVFFAFVCGGLVFGTVAPASYIVDAHRDLSVEAFTCMLLFKNVICWALCYEGFTWLSKGSPKQLFTIIASVEIGICVATIPLYVFGKKSRSFFSRYDYLRMIGLR